MIIIITILLLLYQYYFIITIIIVTVSFLFCKILYVHINISIRYIVERVMRMHARANYMCHQKRKKQKPTLFVTARSTRKDKSASDFLSSKFHRTWPDRTSL